MSGINTPTYKINKNAGMYRHRIYIYQISRNKDNEGFNDGIPELVLKTYASIKTTRGMTIIANNSDFEKAYTRFLIRYSDTVVNAYYNSSMSNRKLIVEYNNKTYEVEYLNNIDELNIEIELQCKEVMK